MITFIPAWGGLPPEGMVTDDLIGSIQSFMTSKQTYTVLISDYLPELRYFLHRYGLLESHYASLFDDLQNVTDQTQHPLTLKDLNFPAAAYFTYSPFCFLVYERTQLVGKVFVGSGSQILEVHYLKKGVLESIEWYDDRGFLSSRQFYEGGEAVQKEYLDHKGEWVIRESLLTGRCDVNPLTPRRLSFSSYESFEAIKFEWIERKLRHLPSDNRVVVSLTDRNASYLLKSHFLGQMTLSFFKKRAIALYRNEAQMRAIIKHAHASLVDSPGQLEWFKRYGYVGRQIFQLSPYDTRFKLSRSQELKEEVLYLEVRSHSNEELERLISFLMDYLIRYLSQEENRRKFRVVLRAADIAQATFLDTVIQETVETRFSEVVSQAFSSHGPETQENRIDEAVVEATDPKLVLAQTLKASFEVRVLRTESEVFELMNDARLIIDLGSEPDLLTQVAGISAGLPQINAQANEYVQHQKNGWIIQGFGELDAAISYYLNSLRHWQEARTAAVKQIKKYSGVALRRRISKIAGDEDE